MNLDMTNLIQACRMQQVGTLDLKQTMAKLKEADSSFYWAGIYFLRGAELVLGPFAGPDTDHVRIPVGRGVCGTAVAENASQNVPDVSALDNYLACNLLTKSELVVLIRNGEDQSILGQIDIDCTKINGFDYQMQKDVEELAQVIAPHVAHELRRL